ncbi:WSC-domain-containing protein [Trametes maxima]|nr:WSC-domain-containing protein [Trametes maxima]
MFSKLISLAALATAVNAEHWIFGGSKLIAQTRLDSIVNPNAIGTHVHAIVGASGFSNVYDPDELMKSNCTTIPVQPDKSNYWAPQMYHHDQQGMLTPIQTGFNIYYLVRNGPKNEKVHAFPKGLRMLAGDTARRTYNASSFADQAVSFVCLDYSGSHNNDPDWAERPNFFDHNCPNGMRAQVFFPSCWDGKNLDSPDHKSHMAYPVQAYNTGDCPDSHPVHLVSLFYEMFVSVDQFDYHGAGTWVLANGDTTGYGHHGDFQNGWDIDLLQEAIDTCTAAQGNVMDCPPLKAVFDQDAADACVLQTSLVDEDIGLTAPISRLPGCNPIYGGKAESCADFATPQLVPAQTPLPSGWTELGCIAEGTNGRALPALQMKDPKMTKAMCASYCGSHGYKLAGVEFSDECYCDNAVKNGASTSFLSWTECSAHCAGNNNEICGGAAKLSLLSTANPGAAPVSSSSSATSVSSAAPKPVSSANAPSSVSASSVARTSVAATPSAPSAATTSVARTSSVAATSAVHTSSVTAAASSATAHTSAAASSAAAPVASGTAGWTSVGCITDNTARVLNEYSYESETLTADSCLASCAAKGYSLAGIEFGQECYCGNSLKTQNGAGKALAASSCNVPCIADSNTLCGGTWALSLFKRSTIAISDPVPSPAPSNSTNVSDLPSGWSAVGCAKDVPGRALNVDAYTSEQMTIGACIAHCAARGHSMAGLEYARECYCGNAFANGGGAPLADAQCDMACAGDAGKVCGGRMALSLFKKTAAKRSAHKARHFGRAHAHSDML